MMHGMDPERVQIAIEHADRFIYNSDERGYMSGLLQELLWERDEFIRTISQMLRVMEEKTGTSYECSECHSFIYDQMMNGAVMMERKLCFSCNYWFEWAHLLPDELTTLLNGEDHKREAERCVRVNGKHYYYHDDEPGAAFQGHGGAKFTIKFNDGRQVITKNLWAQGTIPAHFRDRLPDNAQFIV